jgi:hypothetical protein
LQITPRGTLLITGVTPTLKRLIDVTVGEKVIGIGMIESTRTEKGVTTLVARNLGHPQADTDDALSTFVWKADQIVDVA